MACCLEAVSAPDGPAWQERRWDFILDLPMGPGAAPDVQVEGTFKHAGDKWIVGEKGKGAGVWTVPLPKNRKCESVTIEVTVYNHGQYAWAGHHASYFGTSPEQITQRIGGCWWNEVPKSGGRKTYQGTFDATGADTIYFKHAIENNWYDVAQQLNRVRVTARPVVAVSEARCQWSRLPVDGGGYITNLAMDLSNPDTVYCGSDKGGIHRSDDGGQTWHIRTTGFDRETFYAVSGILADDKNPGRVFCLTGTGWAQGFHIDGGLWKSEDKGDHWRLVSRAITGSGEGFGKFSGHVLAFDPTNHDIVYAVCWDDGLWVSQDAGETWTQVAFAGRYATGVWVDPEATSRLLVALRKDCAGDNKQPGGLFESRDAGESWSTILDAPDVMDVSRHPGRHDWLAVAANGKEAHVSTDRGRTWRRLALHPKCSAVRKVRWHPGKPSRLWTVGGPDRGIFYTDDAGESWAWPTESIAGSFRYPEDWFASARQTSWTAMASVSDLLIDPTRPDRVYACDFYTPLLSTDGGQTWSQKPVGINAACVYQVVCDPHSEDTLYVTNADFGLLKSTDGGQSLRWPVREGEFSVNETYQLWVSPEDSDHLVLAVTYDWQNPHWTRVGVSHDGGASWKSYGEGLPFNKGGYLTGLAVLDAKGTEILVAYSGQGKVNGGVYRSIDGGVNWASYSAGLPRQAGLFGSGWGCLPNLVSVGRTVYAGTTVGVYAMHAGEEAWRPLAKEVMRGQQFVRTLAVHPDRPDWLWVGTAGGLYVSDDRGATFHRVGPTSMQRCQGFAVDPADPSRWFVAVAQPWWGSTDNAPGTYLTRDDGRTWARLSPSPCTGLEWRVTCDPHRPDTIYVGMNGTGAWRAKLTDGQR